MKRCRPMWCMILLCFAVMMTGCAPSFSKAGGVEISGTPVDNEFHNHLAGGNLVRIGDRLYFNYPKSEASYGVVEISAQGVTPILGFESLALMPFPAQYHMRQFQQHLLVTRTQSVDTAMERVSFETGSTEPFEGIDGITLTSNQYQYRDGVLAQLIDSQDTALTESILHWYYDGEQGVLNGGDDVDAFYIVSNQIYYATYSYTDTHHSYIRCFDCETKTDVSVCDLDGVIVDAMFLCEDVLVIEAFRNPEHLDMVYAMPLHDPAAVRMLTTVTETFRFTMNAYQHTLYLPHRGGVDIYDLTTNQRRTLVSDVSIDECYIVDDTWVYLVQNRPQGSYPDKIFRIKQDGSCFETVFWLE